MTSVTSLMTLGPKQNRFPSQRFDTLSQNISTIGRDAEVLEFIANSTIEYARHDKGVKAFTTNTSTVGRLVHCAAAQGRQEGRKMVTFKKISAPPLLSSALLCLILSVVLYKQLKQYLTGWLQTSKCVGDC